MSLFLDRNCYFKDCNMTPADKMMAMNWTFFALIWGVVMIGILLLFSASGGSIEPWAERQFIRFLMGCAVLLMIVLIDLRTWMKYAYVLYGVSLVLLIAVDIMGAVNMGAQRWLDLGFMQLQPSELMKITLVLALARYFHGSGDEDVERTTHLFIPLLMMAVPVALILVQPDLGTALMLVFVTVAIFFLIGVQVWKFALVGVMGLIAVPIGWHFLHDYQRQRVLTFLDPERDPLGAGYHILQSKITLGSGGFFGKGFLEGTQSHLNFIPEKHTDFIFTILAEECGLIGSALLLALYVAIIVIGFKMALKSCNFFGKILALGLIVNFSLYVFINISMVMGLLPVVGVPLPLVSYGGSAMLVLMAGFGFIENVYVNQEMVIGRLGSGDE